MNDITALTPEQLAEIRQRYSPVAAPKCHICGAEMTIGAASASRIVYACSGATYDDAGCHYAPGRSIADDHYAQSRVTVVDVSDPDVLALVEALEAKQPHHNGMMQLSNELVMAKQRIAELESGTTTASQSDYFASLVAMARVSAEKAMRKFPQPNYVLLKVAEEAGEVVQAGVHYAEKRMEWQQVEGEIVQLLAMLIRLVTEGDQINGITPPAAGIQVIEGEGQHGGNCE